MLVKVKFEESVSANDHIDNNNNSFILLVVCGDTEKNNTMWHYKIFM